MISDLLGIEIAAAKLKDLAVFLYLLKVKKITLSARDLKKIIYCRRAVLISMQTFAPAMVKLQ